MENLLLYLPGIIIFLVASGSIKKQSNLREKLIPILCMLIGALLIVQVFYYNENNTIYAMLCFGTVSILGGVVLMLFYYNLKALKLTELLGIITSVEKRLLSKKGRFKLKDTYTYYPVVQYELKNKVETYRCKTNSSYEKSFQINSPYKLYYSKKTKKIVEKKENIFELISGYLLLGFGIFLIIITIIELFK